MESVHQRHFCSLCSIPQWLPALRVGRSGGTAALCSTSTAPASPGGCAGTASSTASAGLMSISADPEVLAHSSTGDSRVLPALPALRLRVHLLRKLQPQQIPSSSTQTHTVTLSRGEVLVAAHAAGQLLAVGHLPGFCCHARVSLFYLGRVLSWGFPLAHLHTPDPHRQEQKLVSVFKAHLQTVSAVALEAPH